MKATVWMAVLFVMGMCIPVSAKEFKLYVNSDELIYGVVQRENPGMNPNAIGDKHMRNKAYGLLQIRAPYLKDVNRIAGKKEVRRVWGKDKLTMADMKDSAKAEWAFHVYLSYYGEIYRQKTSKIPTAYVYARIHNGGPNGWKDKDTVDYGKAVVAYIRIFKMFGNEKV